ncbi:uncharacterized protein LOC135161051 isoform X2 [Diachasmimorpha longicaudata]|uniref:uncharacterized protein LOC135161051 isoform X2 n=1 Tax=Diachasmimorpha longicaudata TaxID=58733 RepID=UPI0030B8E49A
MRTFVLLCLLFSVLQIVFSAAVSRHSYMNITVEIQQRIANTSTDILAADGQVRQIVDSFNGNISSVQLNYGPEMHRHFQQKYGPKRTAFAENPKFSKDCQQYISDLLEMSEQHQKEMSQYTEKAKELFNEYFGYFTSRLDLAQTILSDMQKKTLNCSTLSSKDNATAPYNCAVHNLEVLKILQHDLSDIITSEVERLDGAKERALTHLHASINDRLIPLFYNEKGIDGWLKTYCSIGKEAGEQQSQIDPECVE